MIYGNGRVMMSAELHDKLISLLSSVEEFKQKEIELKAEKHRNLDAITAAESEVVRLNGELDEIRENQLRLRREMDALRDLLFARDDEPEEIVQDDIHVVTDGEGQSDNEGRKLWRERQKHLRQVAPN
jgi:hypothetical protein